MSDIDPGTSAARELAVAVSKLGSAMKTFNHWAVLLETDPVAARRQIHKAAVRRDQPNLFVNVVAERMLSVLGPAAIPRAKDRREKRQLDKVRQQGRREARRVYERELDAMQREHASERTELYMKIGYLSRHIELNQVRIDRLEREMPDADDTPDRRAVDWRAEGNVIHLQDRPPDGDVPFKPAS